MSRVWKLSVRVCIFRYWQVLQIYALQSAGCQCLPPKFHFCFEGGSYTFNECMPELYTYLSWTLLFWLPAVFTKTFSVFLGIEPDLCGLVLLRVSHMNSGSCLQDTIHHKYPQTSALWTMAFMNLWCGLYYSIWLFVINQSGFELISFCTKFPEAGRDLAVFCLCGAIGQLFIFLTIRTFGSLTNTLICTTRKFFNILLSVLLNGNPLLPQQWIAVSMVFAGLLVSSLTKSRKTSKPVSKKAWHLYLHRFVYGLVSAWLWQAIPCNEGVLALLLDVQRSIWGLHRELNTVRNSKLRSNRVIADFILNKVFWFHWQSFRNRLNWEAEDRLWKSNLLHRHSKIPGWLLFCSVLMWRRESNSIMWLWERQFGLQPYTHMCTLHNPNFQRMLVWTYKLCQAKVAEIIVYNIFKMAGRVTYVLVSKQ